MFQESALVKEMDKLRKFALRLTRNASDAEDLLQSTMLRALEKKDYFQDGTSLFSWTSKIMFNLFASQYRHKKKFDSQYDPAPYIDHASVEPSQEAAVDLVTVRNCMKRLSKEHREILMLVCVRGQQYEEVSEMLQIPVGTVRSRLSRARQQLQLLMQPAAALKPAQHSQNFADHPFEAALAATGQQAG
jgi:RNA polymerase sigma-70 factor (ECF subfamily)